MGFTPPPSSQPLTGYEITVAGDLPGSPIRASGLPITDIPHTVTIGCTGRPLCSNDPSRFATSAIVEVRVPSGPF